MIDLTPGFNGRFIKLGLFINTSLSAPHLVQRLYVALGGPSRGVCMREVPCDREFWLTMLGLPADYEKFFGFEVYINTDADVIVLVERLQRSMEALVAIYHSSICEGPDAAAQWLEIATAIFSHPDVSGIPRG